jgi:hypothetical protein
MTPGRPAARTAGASFGRVLHAEWTKFRTVRGWIAGLIAGVLVMLALGLFASGNVNIGCGRNGQLTGRACLPYVPVGPGGEAVTDSFYFVHQPLTGSGSLTAQVTSLTGRYVVANGGAQAAPGQGIPVPMASGVQPWSKAGIIIKASTRQGSAYAAMMITGGHGVRMQYDYTGDIAGLPGKAAPSAPRWLRLTRDGDVITGYDSTDGSHWATVGTVTLAGLPSTIQAGLFTTSPQHVVMSPFFAGASFQSSPSQATGVFGHVSLAGAAWTGTAWTGTAIGAGDRADYPVQGPAGGAGYTRAGGRFTVTGSGDIAPVVAGPGSAFPTTTIDQHLVGAFGGLIAVIVVATMFMTAEYRRGLIRSTFAAAPRRGRVLAAKAIVAGLVTFVAGLAAALIAVPVGDRLAAGQGQYLLPVSWLTEVRVLAGTAALLAVAAVLAVALGAMLRRSAAAVTTVIVAIVLPYILSLTVLPQAAGDWLLRLTPAAGFAIEQSVPQYAQVNAPYPLMGGYFPLPPWAGFAVLCGYAVAAVGLAGYLLNRRDA